MFRLRPTVLALLLASLAGCRAPPTTEVTTGAVRLAVSMPQALPPGDVTRVTLTISAPDMSPRGTDLVSSEGIWGGVIGDIPAGAHRTFLAQAFNASNTLRYEGRAEDVTVMAGTTGLVALTLQDVSAPPPLTNEAPIIDSLVADPVKVAPGGRVTLTVSAHDPNPGDSLTFAWSAPSGSFVAPAQASTRWMAPTAQGPVNLALTVSDSRGAALSVSLTVEVSAGRGDAEVKVDFNNAPRVVGLTSTQSLLTVGGRTTLSVSASDPDADTLRYQWSSTCEGLFTSASSATTIFTPTARPEAACNNCQVRVEVTDGRGAKNMGGLSLCVSKGVVWQVPPEIANAHQSSLSATPGKTLFFDVSARDPAGSALGFSWTASKGTLGSGTSGSSFSLIYWTAPACAAPDAPPRITATVTNAFGLTATHDFTVTGLPACSLVWVTTGLMGEPREAHEATLLPNGKVLVSGGYNVKSDTYLRTSELYDPDTRTWSATGSMTDTREHHTATLLPDGKVLVTGGDNGNSTWRTAEVYGPDTGTWSTTGSMTAPRHSHTATLLPDGKVLVTGGFDSTSRTITDTAEVYDPATGTWSTTGSMTTPRHSHTATLLPDGKVLVTGGYDFGIYLRAAEVYDPATGTWSATGSMSTPHCYHAAALLPNGQVLVSGGYPDEALTTAEVYDPATGTWSTTGSMTQQRAFHAMTLLPNRKVLLSGGFLPSVEEYDPVAGTWSTLGALSRSRGSHTATRLLDGQVLFAGGATPFDDESADLYIPGD